MKPKNNLNQNADEKQDNNLKPSSLSEYIGNDRVKEILSLSINASKVNHLPVEHMIVTGEYGLGKTALGEVLAHELNCTYKIVSAKSLETVADMNNLLTHLPEILILDEIHGLKPSLGDLMHQAMDNFKYSYIDKENNVITRKINKFSLVGLTTDAGLLTAPLYSRFGTKLTLVPYTSANLQTIIMNAAKRSKFDIDGPAAYELASRSCGIPRLALIQNLMSAYRYALMHNKGIINLKMANEALKLLGIDNIGLSNDQRRILTVLHNYNHPMGINNIAQGVGMGIEEVLKFHEPFLIRSGLVERRGTGRVITQAGKEHILRKVSF